MTILSLIVMIFVLVGLAWFIKTYLTGIFQQVCMVVLVVAVLLAVLKMLGLFGALNTPISGVHRSTQSSSESSSQPN